MHGIYLPRIQDFVCNWNYEQSKLLPQKQRANWKSSSENPFTEVLLKRERSLQIMYSQAFHTLISPIPFTNLCSKFQDTLRRSQLRSPGRWWCFETVYEAALSI